MEDNSPVALVTGANKGIGYEIVRQLSRQFRGTVYLTARDTGRGKAAKEALQKESLKNVEFLQIDVTDKKSIEIARNFIQEKHGGLDILVNNAGVFFQAKTKNILTSDLSPDAIKSTIATNFTGLLDVCQTFFPILKAHARIVNISSNISTLRFLKSTSLKKLLVSDDLTIHQLEQIMNEYIKIASKGHAEALAAGYPDTFGAYAMSKIAVTALTRIQQRIFDEEKKYFDVLVNASCPGFVATDINNHSGDKTVEEGADSAVYLALLPPSNETERILPRGELVYQRRILNWVEEEIPSSNQERFFNTVIESSS